MITASRITAQSECAMRMQTVSTKEQTDLTESVAEVARTLGGLERAIVQGAQLFDPNARDVDPAHPINTSSAKMTTSHSIAANKVRTHHSPRLQRYSEGRSQLRHC